MANYTLPTEKDFLSLQAQAPVTSSQAGGKSKLLDQLKEIENKYGAGANTSNGSIYDANFADLNFEKMQYNGKTDKEIEDFVKASLASKQAKEIQNFNESVLSLYNSLENKKTGVTEQAAADKADIEKIYEQRKTQAEKDALKRGLARSSVVLGKIEQFDSGKISDILKVNEGLSKTIAQIDGDIAALELKKEDALRNFDLEHAAEIVNKISELAAERDKKQAEALKYNNELALKEAEYNNGLEQFNSKKAADDYDRLVKTLTADANAKNQLSQAKTTEIVQAVRSYYDGFADPKEAFDDFMSDSSMKGYLGNYYSTMYSYLKSKIK